MSLNGSALTRSPSWDETLETYRAELGDDDEYDKVLEDGSLEGMINHVQTLWAANPTERIPLNPMSQLRSIVKFFNDFSELTAVYFDADTAPPTLVWGSIRVILMRASSDRKSLRDILDMLEELSLVLPRFKAYEEMLPLDNNLQCTLLMIYAEFCCFCARAVNVLRKGEHILLRQKLWADFQADFSWTIQRVKRLCSNVVSEADIVAMQYERKKYFDALVSRQSTEKSKPKPGIKSCYFLPLSADPRLCGREEELEQVDKALFPNSGEEKRLASLALHGVGGIGKSQIALKYVERARGKFDTILWVNADNMDSLGQSFREIARRCGLVEPDKEIEDNTAVLRVKDWLLERKNRWLLVFDNANDVGILERAWPDPKSRGSVLITTRDFNAAFSPASGGYQVKPFDEAVGSRLLLNILGLDKNSGSNLEQAKEVARTFGGLPLAINQIAKFIHLRKIPLRNFLPLYQRRSADIDSRRTLGTEYEHTLSTVWDKSLSRLSGDSEMLQMLLALFDPECIHESLLIEGSNNTRDQDFAFLNNELDLLDAEAELLRLALIDKNNDGDGKLSTHKLIQTAALRRMSTDERVKCFDVAIDILSRMFPDTHPGSSSGRTRQGDDCLRHVDSLVKTSKTYSIQPRDTQAFAELLLRCAWFLYETASPGRARDYIKLALDNFSDKSSRAYGTATSLLGSVEPDTALGQQLEREMPRTVNSRTRSRSAGYCGRRPRSKRRGVDGAELFRRSTPVDAVINGLDGMQVG